MEASDEEPVKLQRPWIKYYPKHVLSEPFVGCFNDGLSMFRHAVAGAYDSPAIHYFDRTLSYGELDRLSDAFAGILLANGVIEGDRVALYLQNVPQFVICLVGAWKMGAIGVSINPMNRSRELTFLLQDSDARVLVLHRDLHKDVAEPVLTNFPHVVAITTSGRDYQGRHDSRVMNKHEPEECPGTIDLAQALRTGSSPAGLYTEIASDKPAMIVYTSGTTGIPKGAVITHANFAFDAVLWREWMGMRNGGPILAIAPLFHITGLVGHIGAAIATCSPIILSMRFHPEVVADAAQEYQAEFMVGAITAFIAIMNSPDVRPEQFQTLVKVYTGGAPVPAKVAEEFRKKFGLPLRNTYGMTETSSLIVGVPSDLETPVDTNGSFSVGVPVFGSDAYIADEDGRPLPAGEVGEIYLQGPQVISEYWQRPDATSEAFYNGYLRTGDVAYMNEDGWIFIVDRKKDMISASGYKVWPKEVEDVIYTHPAIREVAVVGIKDEYRGETVKAVVSLRPGHSIEPEALIAYCKERMAAYKYPRHVQVVDELPKTATGKILRRELR
jgi:long-chain acyl-CoA synthetase